LSGIVRGAGCAASAALRGLGGRLSRGRATSVVQRCCSWRCRWGASRAVVGRPLVRRARCGRRSGGGAARTRRCCSWHCRWEASRAVVGRPLVPRARGVAVRVVVVGGHVVRSSIRRWCGAHGAVFKRPLVRRAGCGRRSAGGAARARRCCSWRCRWGASRAVVGRPLVPRARGVAACGIFVGGQVVRSSVVRWCGAHGAVVGRAEVPRARGVAVRAVVVGGQVVRSSIGRWCGAHGAVFNRPLVRRAGCGRRSAGGAARTRRCCSWRCRWGASRAVVGRPLVPRARGVAVRAAVVGRQVVRSSVGRWCGAHGAVIGRPQMRRARGAAACGIVVGGQVVRSSAGRSCRAQAALLFVPLS